ncbi:ABC transporter ATP-binding protein [Amycolatopsis sp. K13G38]|uniref:ABC transporter ATP-binding protein n=1 Tax=Amycolatopsis acididurans TaxID=2724524 RepID=A0ABX1IYB3_9PSEU|nr:CocE/NonD family hydrolase [Amycolatopsis acididurans]NKQ52500.1 ABC transporter ATP-binding protein [Amycolatopsis acididurans]
MRSLKLLTVILLLLGAAPATATAAAGQAYSVTTLHFSVLVGPGGVESCDIVGDLYLPADAGPGHRVPAILTTNGFGGSKDDQAGLGRYFAGRDYAVLSYSGLGFGGSGCKITLDDPDWDGQAARQLVSFLGGAPGIAYSDAAHTQPVPALDAVERDARDHNGNAEAYDPRVGMIGGSYGGEVQFAAASLDPRIDTLIPLITWNDLSYSLTPNNTDLRAGVTSDTPGVTKLTWPLLFFTDGALLDSATGFQYDPSRVIGCPNFATDVCPDLASAGTLGYPTTDTLALLRHASVSTYTDRVRVPVLLMQGENDTLFNLNEAIATYQALGAQGTPVKMIWQSWGHSGLTPAPGELDLSNPDPQAQYETARVTAWFDHYLAGGPADTSPGFAYFRDWVPYTGNAAPAYGTAPAYPAGKGVPFYLSGSALVPGTGQIVPGSQSFVTPPAGFPTSSSGIDAFSANMPPDANLPGTYAAWTSAPLTAPVDVAGQPTLDVRADAPSAALSSQTGPGGQLVLFAKLYDVAPDGTESLVHNLIAPARIADPTGLVHVALPAIAHQFAAGHAVRVMLASGDLNYRAGLAATPVTVTTGSSDQVLTLPTVE